MVRVIASTVDAGRFADAYDNFPFDKYPGISDLMDRIFDKYDTSNGNDTVDVLYDRASEQDKAELMRLVHNIGEQDGPSQSELADTYEQLNRKDANGSTTPYEDGYLAAMSHMIHAFNIEF
jgi:hypothetical protein